jgi:hypothetical protein
MTIARGERIRASDFNNLTFFPKGTIMVYDGALWDRVGGIPGWAICNGQNGTINLTDKFIRGGSVARQTGGSNSAQLIRHGHGFTGQTVTGRLGSFPYIYFGTAEGVFSGPTNESRYACGDLDGTPKATGYNYVCCEMTPSGEIDYAGTGAASVDNRPAFCTVIFIEKIV